jgi:D-alanyl-D-alanine carboxypeptidase
VTGDVLIDDRLFQKYRVPNGNLLIDPILVNENMVDVSVRPSVAGARAHVDWRPKTAAFGVVGTVKTVAAGMPLDIRLSNDGRMDCTWSAPCKGTVTGRIPIGYQAPLSKSATFVRTFRVEDPASFARTAFISALTQAGVIVRAPLVRKNRTEALPASRSFAPSDRVASFASPPYAQDARLILKVSLNLGANLSLSLFGLAQGQRTIAGALAAERKVLVQRLGIDPNTFDFPTNGSGSPDSRAAPRATVKLLTAMSRGGNAAAFRSALPVLGVDGSLAGTGRSLPARGHVFAKTGTTIDDSGLKAQVLAGYIDAKNGRRLAFALYANDVGKITSIEDVAKVFDDEAEIVNAIYEAN